MAQEDEGIETWMLLEYCDRGSLQRAIERGKLTSRGPEGGADMVQSRPAHDLNAADLAVWSQSCNSLCSTYVCVMVSASRRA